MTPAEAFEAAHVFYARVMEVSQTNSPAALRAFMTEEQTIHILMATNVLAEDVEHRLSLLEPSPLRDALATMWLHVKMVGVLRSVNERLQAFIDESEAPPNPLDAVFARTIGTVGEPKK